MNKHLIIQKRKLEGEENIKGKEEGGWWMKKRSRKIVL
jgi:hypothetical protein